jgi:hypothetical protein
MEFDRDRRDQALLRDVAQGGSVEVPKTALSALIGPAAGAAQTRFLAFFAVTIRKQLGAAPTAGRAARF